MKIISHRGYWKNDQEKNTEKAFHRSFELGFGTETDIRDFHGKLVISHNIPDGSEVSFKAFLKIYKTYPPTTLALNVKADGLQLLLEEHLRTEGVTDYFFFDMSVPDMIIYLKSELKVFTRQSEYELEPSCYTKVEGVWLDAFNGTWYNKELIINHLTQGKKVAIVSADLHKRDHITHWKYLQSLPMSISNQLILCTDYPEEALSFFK